MVARAGRLPSRPRPLSAPRPVPGRSGGGEGSTRRRARRLRSEGFRRGSRRSDSPRGRGNPASRAGPSPPREPPARSPIRSRSPLRDVPPPARSAIFRAAERGAAAGTGSPVRRLWRGRRGGRGRGAGGREGAGPKGPPRAPRTRDCRSAAFCAPRGEPLGGDHLV